VFLITLDFLLALALALSLKRTEQMPQPTPWKRFAVAGIRLLCVACFVFVTVALGFMSVRTWHYFFDFTIIALGVLLHYAYDSMEWRWSKWEHDNHEEHKTMTIRPAVAKQPPRKNQHSGKAAAPIIIGILFLSGLISVRAHAAPLQSQSDAAKKSSAPSQRTEQKQKYPENDIDVEKPGGARGGKPKWIVVQMMNAKGDNIGRATVTALKNGGVDVKLDLGDLPPGEHALHFHQAAKCDPPDFKSAGPHFNPEKKEHGLQNPKGPHAGDMENFSVGSDGITTATLHNSNVTLRGKDSLLANGGTALIIHAKPDDMKTDPAGNAGDRIACGVIAEP
jgi:Cu-Zn family superoxide dismutase